MAMTGFICHDDYYDKIKRLSNEEVGSLFRNLMLYHAKRYDEMEDFVDAEGIAFDFIANDIDRTEEKYNTTSETNRQNGMKGGRPKKQTEPEETDKNPTKPTETDKNPTKPYKEKEKEKEKDKEKCFGRFTPPTLEQVTEYCQERKNVVNPAKWYNYYLSNGWKVGKNPMKDWKAAVRTWEEGNKGGDGSAGKPTKTVVAQQYQQRDYSNVTGDLRSELDREMEEFLRGTA
jgi:hypothetical protein